MFLFLIFRCVFGTEEWSIEELDDGTVNENVECKCQPCYNGDSCELMCNGQGTCTDTENGKVCDCGFSGWRGPTCSMKGCPGWGESCTGHGNCDPTDFTCLCDAGWEGDGCEQIKCKDDCNSHGDCSLIDGVPQCVCYETYFGTACESRCFNGTVSKDTDYNQFCKCDYCFNDPECKEVCTGHGSCVDGECDCGTVGWRGDYCHKYGCPGTPGPDGDGCSGHGSCTDNLNQIGTCNCPDYWGGDGCEIPICTNNCSDHGTCNSDGEVPFCECDPSWMSSDCSIECFGDITKIDNVDTCVCRSDCEDPSDYCNTTCNNRGSCKDNKCQCYDDDTGFNSHGYWGLLCNDESCPGLYASCSDHGQCLNGECTCFSEGWGGVYCDEPYCPGNCSGQGRCNSETDPPSCECYNFYMGPICDKICVNGRPNDDETECVCEGCYTGDSCDVPCNDHGQCINGTCQCDKAWWGKFTSCENLIFVNSVK